LNPHYSSEDSDWHRDDSKANQTSTATLSDDRLKHVENAKEIASLVQKVLADDTVSDFKPCHYFDYFAGTSTGG
jgi:hypothetical protein